MQAARTEQRRLMAKELREQEKQLKEDEKRAQSGAQGKQAQKDAAELGKQAVKKEGANVTPKAKPPRSASSCDSGRKPAAPPAPAHSEQAAKRKGLSHEASRCQFMVRSGGAGAGSSKRFKYLAGSKKAMAEARKEAEEWLASV